MADSVTSLSLPGCETTWRETLRLMDFDPAILRHERIRNAQPTYGLTLVADYPLPDDILASIGRLHRVCRQALDDRVELYPDDYLHLTVYSLLRSRTSPLLEEELATMWSSWLPRLEEIAGELPSLMVPLRGLSVMRNGAVVICGVATAGLRRLQEQVSRLPGVTAPRNIPPHITIGQVKRPCGTAKTYGKAMAALHRHAADPVGTLRSTRLRVLYYRSRLLGQVIRSAVIPLGRKDHPAKVFPLQASTAVEPPLL